MSEKVRSSYKDAAVSGRQDTSVYIAKDFVPLPPEDAEILTTACDYCIVACGYKVYRWPVGRDGGPRAHQNAFGVDFPRPVAGGAWASPNQHNVVSVDGKPHNILVVADQDSKVVNVGGDHSIRGGTIAKKPYNPESPTRDRLKYPMLRVNGELTRISWDDALDIMVATSKYVIDEHGVDAWAMKMYSYQFWENTHALTKLALRAINTAAWAVHDQPTGHGPDTPGMSDAGIEAFSASYEDWSTAEVLFIAGSDPFESKTIIFNDWILKGIRDRGMKLISVMPRNTAGSAYGEKMGGLFLAINPGTDTLLLNALARIIVENGWEDSEFIDKWINNRTERDQGVFQADGFEDYKEWLLNEEYAELEVAAELTGIPVEKILRTAEMLAKPREDGSRPKTSFAFEKGLYWSNNYLNTAAIASLGLICGAGNRPGQVVSRLGGHQRGMMRGGEYPQERAPEKFPEWRKQGIDLDRWVEDGRAKFAWVIGTTWTHAMVSSQRLIDMFEGLTRGNPHQPETTDKAHAIATFKKRIESGGMVVVHQDIYPVEPIGTRFADLVLPAAGWGEENFARANGERRIRHYAKFNDAPGEAMPDWKIAARFAQKMGFPGFDWKDSNEVFEDAAFYNRNNLLSYVALVEYAQKHGKTGHELLREYGTEGIQAPVRWEDGKLVGTKRIHDTTLRQGTPHGLTTVNPIWLRKFKTSTGRANLLKSPWVLFQDYWEFMEPVGDELWLTTGRINEFWQSGFDDQMRRPYIKQRWPDNWLEIHPDDAKKRGIESGDRVVVSSDRIPVEVGGYSNSPKDTATRGVIPVQASTHLETQDPLDAFVNPVDSGSIDARQMGSAELQEPDSLLGFADPQENSPRRPQRRDSGPAPVGDLSQEIDDPIMKNTESAIRLDWNQIKPMTFTEMQKNGYIEMDSASFEAVAIVTPDVKPGVTFSYFNLPSGKGAANSLAGRVLDPISQRPRYKLARGVVKKIGESPYKYDLTQMTFKPRSIV